MKPKLILCLALVLSGGLFGCSSFDHRSANSKPSTPNLYLHLFASFVYPKQPRLIVSAPIPRSGDFDISMDDNQPLKGRIEIRSGIIFLHFQCGLCDGTNVFDGEVELEKGYTPWPQPYDEKAPFICQPHFVLSTNSSPKSFLKQQAIVEKKQWKLDSTSPASKYFEAFLAGCNTNEVRFLWFLDDNPVVGEMMTINLNKESVFTALEVYNWAEEGSQVRQLSHSQKLNLEKIIGDLPASDKNAEFNKSVFVSLRNGSQVKMFQYNRQHAPAIIQRIYDLSGGYFQDDKP